MTKSPTTALRVERVLRESRVSTCDSLATECAYNFIHESTTEGFTREDVLSWCVTGVFRGVQSHSTRYDGPCRDDLRGPHTSWFLRTK